MIILSVLPLVCWLSSEVGLIWEWLYISFCTLADQTTLLSSPLEMGFCLFDFFLLFLQPLLRSGKGWMSFTRPLATTWEVIRSGFIKWDEIFRKRGNIKSFNLAGMVAPFVHWAPGMKIRERGLIHVIHLDDCWWVLSFPFSLELNMCEERAFVKNPLIPQILCSWSFHIRTTLC